MLENTAIQGLKQDSAVVCIVDKVNEMELFVNLPFNCKGVISIDNISDIYNKKMSELLKNDDSTDRSAYNLWNLFHQGTILRAKILKKTSKYWFNLTINPRQVNSELNMDKIFDGMILQGVVVSSKDGGFYVDLGLDDSIGFCPSSTGRQLYEFAFCEFRVLLSAGVKSVSDTISCLSLEVADSSKIDCKIPKTALIQPGMIVPVKISKIIDDVPHVVFNGRNGLLVDHSSQPRKGEKLNARIMSDGDAYILSASPDLTQYIPRITANVPSIGDSCQAVVISKRTNKPPLISVNGTFTGILLDSRTDVNEGDRITCTVVHIKELFLKVIENGEHDPLDWKQFKVGNVVSVETVKKYETDFICRIIGTYLFVRLPGRHLSDCAEASDLLFEKITPGDVLEECRIFKLGKNKVVSRKPSFLRKTEGITTRFEDFRRAELYHGYVVDVKPFGVFVEFSGGIVGLSPPQKLAERSPNTFPEFFTIGQPVSAIVVDIQEERERLLLNMKLTDCCYVADDVELSALVDISSQYLSACDSYEFTAKDGTVVSSRIGDISVGRIQQNKETGVYYCRIAKGFYAYLVEPAEEGVGEVVVVGYDAGKRLAVVSADKRLISGIRKGLKLNVKQFLEGKILNILSYFVVVSLTVNDLSTIGFLSIKRGFNDFFPNHSLKVGGKVFVVVEQVDDKGHFGFCLLKRDVCIEDSEQSVSVGTCGDAIVKLLERTQFVVSLGSILGRVHITEIYDSPTMGKNPLRNFNVNDKVRVIVTSMQTDCYRKLRTSLKHNDRKHHLVECSMRESQMNGKCANYSLGQTVNAFVDSISNNGEAINLMVSPSISATMDVLQCSRNINVVKNPGKSYRPYRCFRAYIVNITEDKMELSAIVKSVNYGLQPGQKVVGRVTTWNNSDMSWSVVLPNKTTMSLSIVDICDCYDEIDTIKPGDYIYCCVTSLNSVTARESVTKGCSVNDPIIRSLKDMNVRWKYRGFVKEVEGTRVKILLGVGVYGLAESMAVSLGDLVSVNVVGFGHDCALLEISSAVKRKRIDTKHKKSKGTNLLAKCDFDWNEESVHNSTDNDELDPFSAPEETVNKVKRTLKNEGKRLLSVRETERGLVDDGSRKPETVLDYERIVQASPSSSLIWLKYIAYHLENSDIEKARAIGRRSLETISPSDEQEYFNVWVGLLNMENMYGTDETFSSSVTEAAQLNDCVRIFLQAASIMSNSNKIKEAEGYYFKALKKSNSDLNVWLEIISFYYKNGLLDSARKFIFRSAQSLPVKKHIDVVKRSAHHEYKFGDSQKGMTMFESLLSTYPRRTDIWSIYVDSLVSVGEVEGARAVLERSICLNFAPRKMQPLFKKFIEFEKIHGNEGRLNYVRMKATEFMDQI